MILIIINKIKRVYYARFYRTMTIIKYITCHLVFGIFKRIFIEFSLYVCQKHFVCLFFFIISKSSTPITCIIRRRLSRVSVRRIDVYINYTDRYDNMCILLLLFFFYSPPFVRIHYSKLCTHIHTCVINVRV